MGIFHEPWWLDAVAPGSWREAAVSVDGEIVGRMPYLPVAGPLGLRRLLMPPLTPRLGPQLTLRETKISRRIEEQKRLLSSLASQLPPHDQFLQSFHAHSSYWLPLSWSGFTQTTYYSYTLESLGDLSAIRSAVSKGVRSDINKANKRLEIDPDGLPNDMYELVSLTLGRVNKRVPFMLKQLERVNSAVRQRDSGAILLARDHAGVAQAGVFIVWDERSAYYLLGGVRPEARGSGAPTLLLWEAVRLASERTRMFDFEGSRIESIENYFRSFGGRPVPYSQVQHCSRRMRIMQSIQALRN